MSQQWLWNAVRYADDGFGNLIRIEYEERLATLDYCFPAWEDNI